MQICDRSMFIFCEIEIAHKYLLKIDNIIIM